MVSLQPPDGKSPRCLGGPGRAIHEILHALGFFHEQSRSDRDDHVVFLPENVIQRKYRACKNLKNCNSFVFY